MQARILIVEDDPEYAELTSMYLTNEGTTVKVAPTGEIAMEDLATGEYDIVILDVNLPGMDGFEALSELRRRSDVPVIIVSAREADEDVVMGLSAGADEFVSKPVSPRVLAARVRALMRRVRQSDRVRETYRFGPYRFEPDSYLLEKDGERIQLSSRECEVLRYLIEQDGKPRTPEEVFGGVWPAEHGDVTTVAVYVQRLRAKLGDDPGHPRYIETVRGRGYRFNTDELSRQGGRR